MAYQTLPIEQLLGLNEDKNPHALKTGELTEARNAVRRSTNLVGTRPGAVSLSMGEDYENALTGSPSIQGAVEYRKDFDASRALVTIAAAPPPSAPIPQEIDEPNFDITSFLRTDSAYSGWTDLLAVSPPTPANGPYRITASGGLNPAGLDGGALRSSDSTSNTPAVPLALNTEYACESNIADITGVSAADIDAGNLSMVITCKITRRTGQLLDECRIGVGWYNSSSTLLSAQQSAVIGTVDGLTVGWVDFTKTIGPAPVGARKFTVRLISIKRDPATNHAELQFDTMLARINAVMAGAGTVDPLSKIWVEDDKRLDDAVLPAITVGTDNLWTFALHNNLLWAAGGAATDDLWTWNGDQATPTAPVIRALTDKASTNRLRPKFIKEWRNYLLINGLRGGVSDTNNPALSRYHTFGSDPTADGNWLDGNSLGYSSRQVGQDAR